MREIRVWGNTPRPILWISLVTSVGMFLVAIGSGFDRPVEIIGGCISMGLALSVAFALLARRGRATNRS